MAEQAVDVYAVVIAWVVTFTILVALLLSLGFGPVGVVAGAFGWQNKKHRSLYAD